MKTISELKDLALSNLKGNWKEPVLATLVYIVIAGAISGVSNASESGAVQLLSFILQIFIVMPIAYGFALAFLDFIRGEKDGMIQKMFGCFNNYVRALGVSFMVALWTFLWALLLIVPGIIKGLSYSMSYYISKDHPEYTIDQCIEESKRMMDGYKWKLFLLQLSFIGWILLSILTLCIGMLWVIPYMQTTMAHFYEELKLERGPLAGVA